MLSENDRNTAHDLLVSIPEDSQTINSLYKLFELVTTRNRPTSRNRQLHPERWTQRLRTLEGPSNLLATCRSNLRHCGIAKQRYI